MPRGQSEYGSLCNRRTEFKKPIRSHKLIISQPFNLTVLGIGCPIDVPFGLDNGNHCCYFNQRERDNGSNLQLRDPVEECMGTLEDGDMIPCTIPGAVCIDHYLVIECKL